MINKAYKYFYNLIRIPSPVELGRSRTNHLPFAFFRDSYKEGDYTWEDYHKEMQKTYPVKYFFANTIPLFFNVRIVSPLKEVKYWFVSHVFPSRRYHMLDLRRVEDGYRWGWIDSDLQLLYACTRILFNFVEKELEGKIPTYSKEEMRHKYHGPILRKQQKYYDGIRELYQYFKFDRKKEEVKLWEDFSYEKDLAFNKKETQMLIKLIKARGGMWT